MAVAHSPTPSSVSTTERTPPAKIATTPRTTPGVACWRFVAAGPTARCASFRPWPTPRARRGRRRSLTVVAFPSIVTGATSVGLSEPPSDIVECPRVSRANRTFAGWLLAQPSARRSEARRPDPGLVWKPPLVAGSQPRWDASVRASRQNRENPGDQSRLMADRARVLFGVGMTDRQLHVRFLQMRFLRSYLLIIGTAGLLGVGCAQGDNSIGSDANIGPVEDAGRDDSCGNPAQTCCAAAPACVPGASCQSGTCCAVPAGASCVSNGDCCATAVCEGGACCVQGGGGCERDEQCCGGNRCVDRICEGPPAMEDAGRPNGTCPATHCSAASVVGATVCMNESDVLQYCCPEGQNIIDGECRTLTECPPDVACAEGAVTGATACRDSASDVDFCCGSEQVIRGGACDWPWCEDDADCSNFVRSGAVRCRNINSGAESWCCPPGTEGAGGSCIDRPCADGAHCHANPVAGAESCTRSSAASVEYCCPLGEEPMGGNCVRNDCKSGLFCQETYTAGSATCFNGAALQYCCPPGEEPSVSGCIERECGEGLHCSAVFRPETASCTIASEGGVRYCCPPGEKPSASGCDTHYCPDGRDCRGTYIEGALSCKQPVSGEPLLYCCPAGRVVSEGRCVSA